MKQYKFRSQDLIPHDGIPDAYISQSDLQELQNLAGIKPRVESMAGINISVTGMEKQQLEREYGIRPGTDEWFRLWFSRPYMTGEKPIDKK